jgi:hypothetical protein
MPATEYTYHKNGIIRTKRWCDDNGDTHRLDGPAFIRFTNTGELSAVIWKMHGRRHREDGLAVFFYAKLYVGFGIGPSGVLENLYIRGVDDATNWLYGFMVTEENREVTVDRFKQIKTRDDALMNIKHWDICVRMKCMEKLQ